MKLQDYLVSQIRTIVPVLMGIAIAKVAKLLGLEIDPTNSAALTDNVTALSVVIATGIFYAVARALEARWPVAGLLLGWIKAPHYAAAPPKQEGPP